jgi:hypothetical protein
VLEACAKKTLAMLHSESQCLCWFSTYETVGSLG